MNHKRFFGIVRRFEGDETLIEGVGDLRGYWITAHNLDLGDFYEEHNPRDEAVDCAVVFAGADDEGYWCGLDDESGLDNVVDVIFGDAFPLESALFAPQQQKSKLVDAVKRGDRNLVERLLREGADPDSVDESGDCAFYAALVAENTALLRILSAHGADTSRLDIGEHFDSLVRANGGWADDLTEELLAIRDGAERQHRVRLRIEEHLRFNQKLRTR